MSTKKINDLSQLTKMYVSKTSNLTEIDRPGKGVVSGSLLTEDAARGMTLGIIPDLERICLDLQEAIAHSGHGASAHSFISVMSTPLSIDLGEIARFLRNPETNHVLVRNKLMKVVLIHWPAGKSTTVHGHAKGGCVFRLLYGDLVEERFSNRHSATILSKNFLYSGSISYLDNQMAFHKVSNPFETSAISLHAYTPGI